MKFKLKSKYEPKGGQPDAIKKLVKGFLEKNYSIQTLQGITGSGKTFVMANLIEQIGKPTLVLAHNKTLAAQLYQELKKFFPENKVEYFVSYYDYYQPESYIPTTDTYIEKEATINEEIEKMKLSAVASILSRNDTIIVSSISCIYGAGNPKDFNDLSIKLKINDKISRKEILKKFVDMQYERNNNSIEPGKFRVRGDIIDIIPIYNKEIFRIELFGDEIESIKILDTLTNKIKSKINEINIYPAKLFVVPEDKQKKAFKKINQELEEQVKKLRPIEAQRLKRKVKYDIEMIESIGYCTGIENYSRIFDNRKPGEPPFVLLDYFKDDFLLIIDESHQTIPQSRAMYKGDYSRKKNLVDFGFRLPSAFDNRPLKFEEFEKYFKKTLFVSATPGDYEIDHSKQIVEQIIRPTGLLDPIVEVRKEDNQIDDLIKEIKKTVSKNQRVLVTTLTKKMAQDLTYYLSKQDIKVRYLHSDIDSLDRVELIRQLRAGDYDVLVGINLLREGLDIPEVSLVAILDADKEGFLRGEKSLIQTIGRAARNQDGRVILYANRITDSMKIAIDITKERRRKQIQYNKEHNIIPKTIVKEIPEPVRKIKDVNHISTIDIEKNIKQLEKDMKKASKDLDFELAIKLRDEIKYLEKKLNERNRKEN